MRAVNDRDSYIFIYPFCDSCKMLIVFFFIVSLAIVVKCFVIGVKLCKELGVFLYKMITFDKEPGQILIYLIEDAKLDEGYDTKSLYN